MSDALILDMVRTPIGRHGGVLAGVRPDDLAAHVIAAAVARNGIDPAQIDDVIFGAANQAGEDNRNVARMGALLAGLPVDGRARPSTASAPPGSRPSIRRPARSAAATRTSCSPAASSR